MRLSYSRQALRQIDRALSYVSARSPSGATKIESRIAAIAALLQVQPGAGFRTRMPRVRRIFLTPYPYLIDYFVDDDEIVVLRFRHTARNPSSLPTKA
ncbi:MAG TPA: type II toxin-antitoxin system RelE/ParE family toxin [Bradyrhizobium sp.]|nr:type II toxin-antitoxin system RelE/ParE family toxin [Bradyrhizobium sp.]